MSFVSQQGRVALEKVAGWLEAGAPHMTLENGLEIDTFNMAVAVEVDPVCGTSCCIAGAVCQFEGLGLEVRTSDGSMGWMLSGGAMDLAGAYLGMAFMDQFRLFEPWHRFTGPSDSFNSPARGAAVIRHFLATGTVDWDHFNDDGSVCEEPAEEE